MGFKSRGGVSSDQRKLRRKLPKEIKLLIRSLKRRPQKEQDAARDSLREYGFLLSNQTEAYRNAMILLVEEWVAEKGPCVPKNAIYKNQRLGTWVKRALHRISAGTCHPKIEEALKMFKPVLVSSWIEYREEKKRQVEAYVRKHRQLPKQKDVTGLGLWLSSMKLNYRKGLLSEDDQKWMRSLGTPIKSGVRDRVQAYRDALKDYVLQNSTPVPNAQIHNGISIGYWINSQRRAWREGKLPPENLNLLRSLGIPLDPREARRQRWHKVLREWRAEQGPDAVLFQTLVYKGVSSGPWLSNLRQRILNGRANPQDIDLLAELNIPHISQFRDSKKVVS